MADILTTLKNPSRKPYIYKVTNRENGQYYIGSQCSGKTIGVNYFTSSTNKEFREDFKNYKEEKYKIEIIKEFTDPKECGRAENYIIRNYMQKKDGLCLNKAYCCSNKKIFSSVGRPSWNKGIPWPEEARKKMSEAHKNPSEETRKKMSASLKGRPVWNKGIHHSEEARKKMSEVHKGQPSWNKGIPWSEETKQKLSEAHKGLTSPNRTKISIEGEVFSSVMEASKYYNVSTPTIRRWAKNKKHNTVYIEK